jgi:hypothetical protein
VPITQIESDTSISKNTRYPDSPHNPPPPPPPEVHISANRNTHRHLHCTIIIPRPDEKRIERPLPPQTPPSATPNLPPRSRSPPSVSLDLDGIFRLIILSFPKLLLSACEALRILIVSTRLLCIRIPRHLAQPPPEHSIGFLRRTLKLSCTVSIQPFVPTQFSTGQRPARIPFCRSRRTASYPCRDLTGIEQHRTRHWRWLTGFRTCRNQLNNFIFRASPAHPSEILRRPTFVALSERPPTATISPPNTAKLSSPILLPRTVSYDASTNPPRASGQYLAMSDNKTGRRRRSSSLIYQEPPETIEHLSDQAALPNLNSDWVNAKGTYRTSPLTNTGTPSGHSRQRSEECNKRSTPFSAPVVGCLARDIS